MQTWIKGKLSKTSSLVIHKLVTEFIKTMVSRAFKSSHPHLLGRPVVAPNSWPILANCSALESNNSLEGLGVLQAPAKHPQTELGLSYIDALKSDCDSEQA